MRLASATPTTALHLKCKTCNHDTFAHIVIDGRPSCRPQPEGTAITSVSCTCTAFERDVSHECSCGHHLSSHGPLGHVIRCEECPCELMGHDSGTVDPRTASPPFASWQTNVLLALSIPVAFVAARFLFATLGQLFGATQ